MKRSYLHLGVTEKGIVKYVKVTAFNDKANNEQFLICYRTVKDFKTLHSFEWTLKNRQTKPFKKLIDSVFNTDLILAVLTEESKKC